MTSISKNASIGIIGRGFAGLSMARALHLRGYRNINIYGPKNRCGSASRAAVGVVTLKGWNEPRQPMFTAKYLGHKSLPAWLSELEHDTKVSIRQFWGSVYEPFVDLDQYNWIRERVYHREFTGHIASSVVKGAALPFQSKGLGAFHYWQDGWVHPGDLLDALECCATRYRTKFINDIVVRIDKDPNRGFSLMGSDGIIGECKEVVVAPGIFTSKLLSDSGLPDPRLAPVAGWTLCQDVPSKMEYAGIYGKMAYVQSCSQRRFGSTSSQLGIGENSQGFVDYNGPMQTMYLSEFLAQKGIASEEFKGVFGVRARSKDRQPIVGKMQISDSHHLWFFTGLYKSGIQLSHFIANNLAEQWVSGQIPSLFLQFRPDRFF